MNRFPTSILLRRTLLAVAFGCIYVSHADETSKHEEHLTHDQVRAFLNRNCVRCHNSQKSETGLRLDDIEFSFSTKINLEKWVDVMDRLNLGEMPPKDEPRPDFHQQEKVVDWIASNARNARVSASDGEIILRRLNRRQYTNTIRDLIGIDVLPQFEFPEDPLAFGFDNIGSGLSISPVHIEKYLLAARKIVDRALPDGPRPYVRKWHFEIDKAVDEPHYWLTRPDRSGTQIPYARLSTGINRAQDGFLVIRDNAWNKSVEIREFKVHRPGKYIVQVRAAGSVPQRSRVVGFAMQRHLQRIRQSIAEENSDDTKKKLNEYWERTLKPRLLKHFEQDPIYDYGPARLRVVLNQSQAIGVCDVPDPINEPKIFEFAVFLEQTDCNLVISNEYNVPTKLENFFFLHRSDFPRPELFVDWVKVIGPVNESWPLKSQKLILGSSSDVVSDEVRARKVLTKFMSRAFRRPVRSDELEQMLELFKKSRKSTSFLRTIKVPLIAVLTSPNFLYLAEPDNTDFKSKRLSSYELAARLSYFLWQSMPDDALFDLAKSNQISEPRTLDQQIDRMLDDPKSQSFTRSFSTQWLGIDDAGAVRPDKRLYSNFDEHLLESMLGESENFFAEILKKDLPVFNFLNTDFTMLNERLARFYGIKGVAGDQFRAVKLSKDHHRGGVFTQASVHLVTSNGTRTSPVKRGVWMLENILGTPPSPPPPNAGDIEPSVPGISKATVRDRLEAHRTNPACASCHAKIDPFGFALENFDAIGRWRDREGFGYEGRIDDEDPEIDNLGSLPDGQAFRGVHELQALLVKRSDEFLRCFVEKLMTFGLGRGITFSDRETIDAIIAGAPNHGYTVKGLIKDVVKSNRFLTK